MDCTITCPCGYENVVTEDEVPSGESLASYAAWKGARHEENCEKTVGFQYGEPSELETKMGNMDSFVRNSKVVLRD